MMQDEKRKEERKTLTRKATRAGEGGETDKGKE
jgi:hypothetical protein